MVRRTLSLVAFVFLLAVVSIAQQGSDKPWRFAISGDSRNCGDVVMPGISKSVLAHEVEFYWHLGDFRIGYDVDEDMQQSGGKPSIAEYRVLSARLRSVRPGRHGSEAVTLRHPIMPVANGLGRGLVGINGDQL
jgi:hypothetical protein